MLTSSTDELAADANKITPAPVCNDLLPLFDVNFFIRKTLSNFELSNLEDNENENNPETSFRHHRPYRLPIINTDRQQNRYISEPESSIANLNRAKQKIRALNINKKNPTNRPKPLEEYAKPTNTEFLAMKNSADFCFDNDPATRLSSSSLECFLDNNDAEENEMNNDADAHFLKTIDQKSGGSTTTVPKLKETRFLPSGAQSSDLLVSS